MEFSENDSQCQLIGLPTRTQDDTIVFTMFIITDTIEFHTITDKIIPFQSGNVFYQRAKLTGAQYKHRVLFTVDDNHRVIFTMDDHMFDQWVIRSTPTQKMEKKALL